MRRNRVWRGALEVRPGDVFIGSGLRSGNLVGLGDSGAAACDLQLSLRPFSEQLE